MYECYGCGAYVHHRDSPPMEIDGHLYCEDCQGDAEENVVRIAQSAKEAS